MRLAVVNLTAGGLSGGYRSYLRHLLPLLAEQPDLEALRVVVPPAGAADLSGLPDMVRAWPEGIRGDPTGWIRHELEEFRPDLVFVPTARRFRFDRVPTVVMVRNMEPLVCPVRGNPPLEALRNLARREVAHWACRSADRIIAVSEFVRDFLRDRWKLPSERMGVVRHGVVQAWSAAGLCAPPALRDLADESWVFTAGSLRPARGLEDVLRALALLEARGEHRTLAVAGEPDPATKRFATRLKGRVIAMGLGHRVRWLGRLSAAEMGWCFRHAGAFVMTSRAEACPNTVLEAMAQGALSISTTQPPMPEFFGDTASYYAPGDAGGLARALESALALPPDERARRREAGRRRAQAYTWSGTARETMAELERALP
jgi:glycosyltransferase involved in cell wall biosynthesis